MNESKEGRDEEGTGLRMQPNKMNKINTYMHKNTQMQAQWRAGPR